MSEALPRILIVEDEAVIAFVLRIELEERGYTVCETVDSGEDAVRSVVELKPDIVLMDIRIRGSMDGIATAAAIRGVASGTKIIFITGYGNAELRTRAAEVEPVAFLEKPIQVETLIGYL